MPTLEEIVSRKKAVTATVEMALDPELAEELQKAREARDIAARAAAIREKDTDAQAALWQAEEKVTSLEQRMRDEDAVAYFKLRSIGRAAFDALVDAHPPSAAQRAKAKSIGLGELLWNAETFPVALVAACLVEPAASEEEVRAMWADDSWNAAELQSLIDAALEINGTRRVVQLGKDSAKTLSSGRS